MKTLRQTFLVLIAILLFSSCSSDDDSSVETPNSIEQTEWENTVGGLTYYIYFSVDNNVYFSHPMYNGQWTTIDIDGTYNYNKPSLTMNYTGECNNSGFVFSSCDVSGSISGDTLTVTDNGEEFEFYRKYD